jgi:hypothetical protein
MALISAVAGIPRRWSSGRAVIDETLIAACRRQVRPQQKYLGPSIFRLL